LTDRCPRSRVAARALAVTLVVLAACTPKPQAAASDAATPQAPASSCTYPITSRDWRHVDVTLRAAPRRIVSLLPSDTETLFALGLGPSIVGVDDYSADVPGAGALPHLGGLYDARIEALLALQPDLAFVSDTSSAAAPLERAGIPTWGGSATKFDEIPHVIESIAAIVCREPEGARLAGQIADDVAAVEKAAAGRGRVRVYYELDASLYTVGPHSFIGTMIAKAGGEDIVPEGLRDFPKISPEAIIAGDPAVIFGATMDDVRARPGWDKITAVREGHVYKLTAEQGGLVARPGPRIAEGLRILLRHIHPEVTQ
jgi:iron complex transport system substrate-binding protein